MVIGLLSLEIFLPYAHSLKEKRKSLKSFKDRIKGKYNVALAELDYQDKWQRLKLGIVTLNSQKTFVEQVLHKILQEAEQTIEGEILNYQIQYF
jgi:hypothetical protein